MPVEKYYLKSGNQTENVMSRIGKLPITIPSGVTLEVTDNVVEVTGPKGNLTLNLHERAKLEQTKTEINISVKDINSSSIHGLTRSLIANMVKGVTDGWKKTLELSGTGYRANTSGAELQLALGFSHPVVVKAPPGINFEVKENKISVLGIDKALVGEVAAKIRALKPADPYKLKGFKYENEIVIKKAGKAAKVGAQ